MLLAGAAAWVGGWVRRRRGRGWRAAVEHGARHGAERVGVAQPAPGTHRASGACREDAAGDTPGVARHAHPAIGRRESLALHLRCHSIWAALWALFCELRTAKRL